MFYFKPDIFIIKIDLSLCDNENYFFHKKSKFAKYHKYVKIMFLKVWKQK